MNKQNLTLANNIKQLLEKTNISVAELSEKLKQRGYNITQDTIYKWCRGYMVPRQDKIEALCKIFDVDEAELRLGDAERSTISFHDVIKKSFPLLGSVACGEPVFADEDRTSIFMADENIDADFCLICKGDSMIDCGIHDGDIVFIKRQATVNNSEIAVVLINDEATLKRVYYDKQKQILQLIPENKKYSPMVFTGSDAENIRILGKAVFYQSVIR